MIEAPDSSGFTCASMVQHRDEPVGIVAAARGDHDADAVGLVLHAAVQRPQEEPVLHQVHAGIGELGLEPQHVAAPADAVGRDRLGARGGRAPAGVGLDRRELVLLQHVRDLVREDARQFRLVGEALHQAVRDHHRAPGHREGVDDVGVDHAESPRQVRALRLQGKPAADAVHVALQALVRVQPDGAEEPRGDAFAEGHLLLDGVLLGGLLDFRRHLERLLAEVEHAPQVELRLGGSRAGQRQRREQHPHEPSLG